MEQELQRRRRTAQAFQSARSRRRVLQVLKVWAGWAGQERRIRTALSKAITRTHRFNSARFFVPWLVAARVEVGRTFERTLVEVLAEIAERK